MFEIESTLGTGAFGDVYKVNCNSTSKLNEKGVDRKLINKEEALEILKN